MICQGHISENGTVARMIIPFRYCPPKSKARWWLLAGPSLRVRHSVRCGCGEPLHYWRCAEARTAVAPSLSWATSPRIPCSKMGTPPFLRLQGRVPMLMSYQQLQQQQNFKFSKGMRKEEWWGVTVKQPSTTSYLRHLPRGLKSGSDSSSVKHKHWC